MTSMVRNRLSKSLRQHMRRLVLALTCLTLSLVGLLAAQSISPQVFAGSGSGGGAGSCAVTAWWYPCVEWGEGWAVYSINSTGPKLGFINHTTSWSNIQNDTGINGCKGFSQVAVFVIDGSGSPVASEGFTYGPDLDTNNFLSSPSPPFGPDNGATPISTNAAYTAYNNAPAWSKNPNLRWGDDSGNGSDGVGWFCYSSAPSNVTIQGRVVNQATGQGVSGVKIDACGYGATTTNSSGNYSFSIPQGNAFCLKPESFSYDGQSISSSQLYNRPWGFNYGDPAGRCPSYGATSPPYSGNCAPVNAPPVVSESNQTYECQVAGHSGAEPCPGNSSNNTYVNSGGGGGYDFVFDLSCPAGYTGTPPSCVKSPPCPGDPGYDSSSRTTLSTPYKNLDGTSAPSGTTASYGATVNQDTNISNGSFVSNDTSKGGTRYPPPIVSYNSTKTAVTIDPTGFVNNYPYDVNKADVTYTTYYDLTVWTASKFDHWQCNNGGSYGAGGANNCGTYTVSDGDPGCAYPATYNGVPFCAGYNPCPNQGSPPNGCYHTDSYPSPTAYYRYVSSGPYSETASGASTVYSMNACLNRTFSVTSATAGTVSFDDLEDPTEASGNGTVTATLGPSGAKFRQPLQVNLQYTANYTFEDSSGNPTDVAQDCSATSSTTVGPISAPGTDSETVYTTTGPSVTGNPPIVGCNATIGAPPLEAGDVACVVYKFWPTGDYMDIGGTPQPGNGESIYSTKVCSQRIADEPYAQFFINDVAAGGAFDSGNDQCESGYTGSGDGSILAWLEAGRRGSGVQFGALPKGSGGSLDHFGSALLRGTGPANAPYAPNGLTFPNYPSVGGSLATKVTNRCIPNYYGSGAPSDAITWAGGIPTDSDTTRTMNVYNAGTSLTIGTSGLTVPLNTSSAIYVDGNVTINGDIKYQTNGWRINPGSADLTNVPSLYIIAKGNINIGPSVTELDGVYVAQPTIDPRTGTITGGGTINTCNTGVASFDQNTSFTECGNNQLTVYGSFVANEVDLYRTFASLRDSAAGESPQAAPALGQCDQGDGGNHNGSNSSRGGGLSYDCAAELFIFSPANYLSSPALPAIGGPQTGKFDAISTLSPVL